MSIPGLSSATSLPALALRPARYPRIGTVCSLYLGHAFLAPSSLLSTSTLFLFACWLPTHLLLHTPIFHPQLCYLTPPWLYIYFALYISALALCPDRSPLFRLIATAVAVLIRHLFLLCTHQSSIFSSIISLYPCSLNFVTTTARCPWFSPFSFCSLSLSYQLFFLYLSLLANPTSAALLFMPPPLFLASVCRRLPVVAALSLGALFQLLCCFPMTPAHFLRSFLG